MRHFKQLTLIILTLSLLLCGCGNTNSNNNANNGTNNNGSTNNETTNNNSENTKNEFSLSEYLFSGETIWFVADGYGKDNEIDTIYVFEPNGTVYYCDSNWKIGEAEQKEDSEIISYVKQEYEKNMTEAVNKAISWNGKRFDDYSICISDTATLFTPYLNIKPAQYKLSIISDSTGNNTAREVIAFQEFAPVFRKENSWKSEATITYMELIRLTSGSSTDGNCHQVYDSWYGGYVITCFTSAESHLNESYNIDGYLLTRVNSNKIAKLDTVGTANIGIDNADSLFEEIIIDFEFESVDLDY